MTIFNPYLNFLGNTEEAFNFYKSVFGGDFLALVRFGDTSEAEKLPEENKNKIMHIALPLNENTILMGTDCLPDMGQNLTFGNNFSICIDVDSRHEADRLFNDLSKDGNIKSSMADMDWGDYFGYFFDKFGVQWMISLDQSKK